MKKKLSLLLAVALALLVIASCAANTEPISAFREVKGDYAVSSMQISGERWSFQESIENATDIMRATFKEYIYGDGYYELKFEVVELLRGETTDKTIYAFVSPSNFVGMDDSGSPVFQEYNFVENHDYLLVLARNKSVYWEHDRYSLVNRIFIPLEDDIGAYMQYEPIEWHNSNESVPVDNIELSANQNIVMQMESLAVMPDDYEPFHYYTTPYSEATETDGIIRESEYALVVTVESLSTVSPKNGTDSFVCKVDEVLMSKATVQDTVNVVFPINSAESGDRYLVLLNRPGDDSLIFTLSSKNSVIPLTDTETVQEVRDLVAAQSGTVTE